MLNLRLALLCILVALASSLHAADQQVPPTITITKAQADALFKGKAAKMVIGYQPTKKVLWRDLSEGEEIIETTMPFYLLDFSVQPLACVLVASDSKAILGDPFISPDGSRVAYHKDDGIYIAKLAAGAPGSTKVVSEGFDQRWWINPTTGDEYLIYVSTRASNNSNMEGVTSLQKIKKGSCEADGAPTVLISNLAYRGGRSIDGTYICSTQPGLCQAQITPADAVENASTKILFTNARKCNGSISQDPAHPNYFLWEDTSHSIIFYDPADLKKTITVPPGYGHQQWCEWATNADYVSASPCADDDFADHKLHDAHIYQWSTKTWTPVTKGSGPTHLWVAK